MVAIGAVFAHFSRALPFLSSLKQIVRDDPLLPVVESPQFGTGQIKEPPVVVPLVLVSFPVGLRQNRCQLAVFPILIERGQPGLGGFGIVRAVDAPVVDARKILSKVEEEVVAGHGAAGEKVVAHPAAVLVLCALDEQETKRNETQKKRPKQRSNNINKRVRFVAFEPNSAHSFRNRTRHHDPKRADGDGQINARTYSSNW